MLSRRDLRLITLGRLALIGSAGDADPSLAARRRKLAVLAVLAMARRPMSRDQLAEMFWGGQPEERARHSLSSTLSHLRRVLGRHAITARAAEVELTADGLEVDALQFVQAVEQKRDAAALELYAGPFLEGVFVDGCPSFDQWVTAERTRLEGIFLGACQRRCIVLERVGRWDECADLARRWLDAAPLSSEGAVHRLQALNGPGTREAGQRALAEFERIRQVLKRDYELRPDKAVVALSRQIAEQVRAAGAETTEHPIVFEKPEPASVAQPVPAPVQGRRLGRRATRALLGAVALVVVAIGAQLAVSAVASRGDALAAGATPVVAIIDVAFLGGDTASVWIAEGLPRMMATKLARSRDVEVISPEHVQRVRARAELAPRSIITPLRARELARGVGAEWVITGSVIDADTSLQLDLTIRDVRTGELVRTTSVHAPNVLSLADAAAARVLDAAGVRRHGADFAQIETPSLEAYEHYVRFLDIRATRADAWRELDAAIALDSGFVAALVTRMEYAEAMGDDAGRARLESAFQRAAHRATDWDRLTMAANSAFRSGDWARTEATARAVAERFPRDPRAYDWLIRIYQFQGRWQDLERVALAQLGIDSLGASIGRGPCAPCLGYSALATFRMNGPGDYAGAEEALVRLTQLQPHLSHGWHELSKAQAAQGRYDDALRSQRRAIETDDDPRYLRIRVAHLLIMARRLDAADSVLRSLPADTSAIIGARLAEARVMLELERGRPGAALAVAESVARQAGTIRSRLVADALARLGEHDNARRMFLDLVRGDAAGLDAPGQLPGRAQRASMFTRYRALMADALAPSGDTVLLAALADSMETIGALSFHGRDRILHHHARGHLALLQRRWADAERHFALVSRWSAWGWTSSLVGEATAQLEAGRPADALATLRRAYDVPPDHMGRYVVRSELDVLMASAFRLAGLPDSAEVYAGISGRR